jgi:Domain of unknown function (DUF4431)
MKPLSLTSLLTCVTCIVALACGHDAAAPAAPATISEPVAARTPSVAALTAAHVPTRCIEVDAELGGKRTTLEGRIFVDTAYEHPTRGKTHPLILRLDAPRCALGIEDKQITEIHLAASEGVALKPLVGKHVRVSGDPFVAHTAWHARPIVLMSITAAAL